MPDQQPAIIRPSKLPAMLGISMATINRLRASDQFVKPIRLGTQAIGFRRTDIEEWLASRPVVHHFAISI